MSDPSARPAPAQPPSDGQRATSPLTPDAADALAALVQSSDDAIYSKDRGARITSWNPSAARLYGYSAEEALGRDVSMLIPEDRAGEELEILGRILQGERVDHYETRRVAKDGRMIDVEVTVSPVRNKMGEIVQASVIARDIRDRKLAEEAAAIARETQAANEAIQEFVAMATHDLRSPLTVVSGLAATLRENWSAIADERKLELLDAIDRNAKRMSRLVADLLTLSRAEMRRLHPAVERVDVRRCIADVVDELDVAVETTDVPKDSFALVDLHHLHRMMTNLVLNAGKYGRPPISISATRDGPSVLIAVSDAGPGVPDDLAGRLFSTFARGPATREKEGTGLGLAIVRSLAEANRGEVWYEPRRPHGAEFFLRLPATD